jgi:pentatricopeptide repeat protein
MAIKLDRKLSVAYDKLANILIQQGELDEAIKVYSQAIELMPKKPDYTIN